MPEFDADQNGQVSAVMPSPRQLGINRYRARQRVNGTWSGWSDPFGDCYVPWLTRTASGILPSAEFDFVNNRYFLREPLAGATPEDALPAQLLDISGSSFTRAGARYFGTQLFASGEPRIVSGEGLRLSAGATNLVVESDTHSSSPWASNADTLDPAPASGDVPMWRHFCDSILYGGTYQTVAVTAGETYVAQARVRKDTSVRGVFRVRTDPSGDDAWAQVEVNYATGVATLDDSGGLAAANPSAIPTGIADEYDVSFTFTIPAGHTTLHFMMYAAFNANGATIWGAPQLTLASSASDYIPTTAAAASAGDDYFEVPLASLGWEPGSTLVADMVPHKWEELDGYLDVIVLAETGVSTDTSIFRNASQPGTLRLNAVTDEVIEYAATLNPTPQSVYRIAYRIDAVASAASQNGEPAIDLGGFGGVTGIDTLRLPSEATMTLKSLTIYPPGVTNADLVALSEVA